MYKQTLVCLDRITRGRLLLASISLLFYQTFPVFHQGTICLLFIRSIARIVYIHSTQTCQRHRELFACLPVAAVRVNTGVVDVPADGGARPAFCEASKFHLAHTRVSCPQAHNGRIWKLTGGSGRGRIRV